MPTFVTSVYTFGPYTFPAGFRLSSRSNKWYSETAKIPFQYGSYSPTGRLGGKTVALSGTVGGFGAVDANGSYILTRDQAFAELDRIAGALQNGFQPLSAGDADGRTLTCTAKSMRVKPIPGSGQTAHEVEIELYAPDPRWIAPGIRSFVIPPGSDGPVQAVLGNAIMWPVLTITGPQSWPPSNFVVYLSPAGSGTGYAGGRYLSMFADITFSLGSGQTMTIDCSPYNRSNAVTVNGVPQLSLLNHSILNSYQADDEPLLIMYPGTTYSHFANGSPSPAGITVSWQEAYWA
jgi:hypothetical protein